MASTVSVSLDIHAPAEEVWALISDVTRMGDFSPENDGAVWLDGAQSASPGVRFKGTNSNGSRSWSTTCTVIEAEPGRSFAFRVKGGGMKVATWRYDIEPTATGCQVAETWIDERGALLRLLGKPVSGVDDRAAHNREGMVITLENLKAAAEA
jgi:uncharacterized protein YndB with AHSA1/START domain